MVMKAMRNLRKPWGNAMLCLGEMFCCMKPLVQMLLLLLLILMVMLMVVVDWW